MKTYTMSISTYTCEEIWGFQLELSSALVANFNPLPTQSRVAGLGLTVRYNYLPSLSVTGSTMESQQVCGICTQPGTHCCSGCQQKWYCSAEHERQDKKQHQADCKPYKMVLSSEYGRHLIASRTIRPGEVILKEEPLVVGPFPLSTNICFGCHQSVETIYRCKLCGSPLCEPKCQISALHKKECKLLKKLQQKEISALAILPFRCFLLQNSPQWASLMDLESHCETRKARPEWDFTARHIVPFLQKVLEPLNLGNVTPEMIQKVCGILDVNSFEVRAPNTQPSTFFGPVSLPQQYGLRALYPSVSLLTHSCIANTFTACGTDNVIIVKSRTNIPAGTVLTINYTDPMETAISRQEALQQGKYFTCRCPRCLDPTELNTFTSAIRCTKCKTGYLLPQTGNQYYECSCAKKLTFNEVKALEAKVRDQWEKLRRKPIDKSTIQTCENLLAKLNKILHPNHALACQIKAFLVNVYGNSPGQEYPDLKESQLNRLKDICRELLNVYKPLEPGISRHRGMLLHTLHIPIIMLANQKFENGQILPSQLILQLHEAESYLRAAVELLIHEPPNSPESVVTQTAISGLRQLRQYIQEVKKLKDDEVLDLAL